MPWPFWSRPRQAKPLLPASWVGVGLRRWPWFALADASSGAWAQRILALWYFVFQQMAMPSWNMTSCGCLIGAGSHSRSWGSPDHYLLSGTLRGLAVGTRMVHRAYVPWGGEILINSRTRTTHESSLRIASRSHGAPCGGASGPLGRSPGDRLAPHPQKCRAACMNHPRQTSVRRRTAWAPDSSVRRPRGCLWSPVASRSLARTA